MLELTGLGSVLRSLGVLYWLLAVVAISLSLWKGKTVLRKVIWGGVSIVIFGFLPVKMAIEQAQRDAYVREAWAYFKKKCDTEAGEKIYKTFTGVKSVLVVKPLPPATEKDLYDQYWYGDPYSSASTYKRDVITAARLTLRSQRPNGVIQEGLEFVEIKQEEREGIRYQRISSGSRGDYKFADIPQPISQFGIVWEDISTSQDRSYWVAGSRLRVLALTDNSIIGERIGFLIEAGFGSEKGGRRPWLAARGLGQNGRSCPNAHDYSDQWFITSIFKQDGRQ